MPNNCEFEVVEVAYKIILGNVLWRFNFKMVICVGLLLSLVLRCISFYVDCCEH